MAGGCNSPELNRNPFHSGNFSERTMDTSHCSPDLLSLSGRRSIAPRNLKLSYAYGYWYSKSFLCVLNVLPDESSSII